MARLWLAGESNVEIAKRLGVSEASIFNFCKSGKIEDTLGFKTDPEFTDIDPPLYDVWKAKASSNATKHPGQTEALFTDRLLYLYTKPGEMVIDPFVGGGTTIDVCKRRFRRYFVSDSTPIPARQPVTS